MKVAPPQGRHARVAYRIIELTAKGYPKTLFHGIDGSRVIEPGTWLKAARKWVTDGDSPTHYWSGFHCLMTLEECKRYLKKFKATRRLKIVKVLIRGELRNKAHSPAPVILADEMFLLETSLA